MPEDSHAEACTGIEVRGDGGGELGISGVWVAIGSVFATPGVSSSVSVMAGRHSLWAHGGGEVGV